MTRILMVETASPKRVRKAAEKLMQGGKFPQPEITILCGPDPTTIDCFREIPNIQVVPMLKGKKHHILRELRCEQFDVMYTFWTGEKKYRFTKWSTLRMGTPSTYVDSGDGGGFKLTWKAPLKFLLFRLGHPLPTDHWDLVSQPEFLEARLSYDGERILVVQSADPPCVLRALDRLKQLQNFRNPRYTLFCQSRPEVLARFHDHPMIFEVRTHSGSRVSWRHLRQLRQQRYDGVVVFFTGDRRYWKIKHLAFFLRARHKVIFNENNDPFYFTWLDWSAFMAHRWKERAQLRVGPHRHLQLFSLLRILVFPFRFAWLLVWYRQLRSRVHWDRRQL